MNRKILSFGLAYSMLIMGIREVVNEAAGRIFKISLPQRFTLG